MARPKKTDEELLISILEKYYAEEMGGYAGRIKYVDLQRYAQKQGIEVKEYEFRRSQGVRDKLKELLADTEVPVSDSGELIYKSLDVDGLFRTSKNLAELRDKLQMLDQHWKRIYDRSVRMNAENRKILSENADIRREYADLNREMEQARQGQRVLEKENKTLKKENAYLKKMLERYLYPELAKELMKEAHLPVSEVQHITPFAKRELIEGKTPMAFDGIQGISEKVISKEEQLLAEMRRLSEE